jgi:thioredoxin 1
MNNVEHGTDANFDELVAQSDVPVLVDFWAPWCGPCRAVGPVMEQIADEFAGRVKVVKVNVDEESGVAGSLGVRSIPTIVLYHKGEPQKTLVGARPKEEFVRLINEALGH